MRKLTPKFLDIPLKRRSKIRVKLVVSLVLVVIILILLGIGIVKVNDFFNKNYLQFNQVISIKLQVLVEIKHRETPVSEIIKVIEKIPYPNDLDTPAKKKIFEVFGIENYRLAIAVSQCEGLNHPVDGFNVNTNGSIDVGYLRINSIHFGQKGCSLNEVSTLDGNITCAYKIWDEANKITGDKIGSFGAWVGFTNGCASTKL